MAWMNENEILINFAADINGAVSDWFWTREDAISELQKLSELEDSRAEIITQFWIRVQHEGEFLANYDWQENMRDREAYYGPNVDNSWMEPGVAYTMGNDGEYESWEDPRNQY